MIFVDHSNMPFKLTEPIIVLKEKLQNSLDEKQTLFPNREFPATHQEYWFLSNSILGLRDTTNIRYNPYMIFRI